VVNVFLVRHGSTADTGRRLSGRSAGVHLNNAGRHEARAVANALVTMGIEQVYSSPLERAAETAMEIASAIGLSPETSPLLNEIDFGQWTGLGFDALAASTEWTIFNAAPDVAQIPGGESLDAVAERGVRAITVLATRRPCTNIAMVTHGDVIRLTLARVLSMPLVAFRRVAIAPASITCLRLAGASPHLVLLNHPPGGRLTAEFLSS
jgi:broad specificity phosphatase PhoE